MTKPKTGIACVTGATGLVGGWIVHQLLEQGWHVRVLTRQESVSLQDVEVLTGDLKNISLLKEFVEAADAVFHCAAELRDETLMHSTNTAGTNNLLTAMEGQGIAYFCYLSSAGVVGPVTFPEVNEETPCYPSNTYEKTKYEAEQMVFSADLGVNVCVLRPTNVFDARNPGILSLLLRQSLMDKLKLILKGNEGAHLVHARDVASAALYFLYRPLVQPQLFFVSCDSDERNTLAGVYKLLSSICGKKRSTSVFALPNNFPYLIRMLIRGKSLHGCVRFSEEKLRSTGFVFPLGFEEGLIDVCRMRGQENVCGNPEF